MSETIHCPNCPDCRLGSCATGHSGQDFHHCGKVYKEIAFRCQWAECTFRDKIRPNDFKPIKYDGINFCSSKCMNSYVNEIKELDKEPLPIEPERPKFQAVRVDPVVESVIKEIKVELPKQEPKKEYLKYVVKFKGKDMELIEKIIKYYLLRPDLPSKLENGALGLLDRLYVNTEENLQKHVSYLERRGFKVVKNKEEA